VWGCAATGAEEPDDHRGCEHLDERVAGEAGEGDRAGGDAGSERDSELGQVPAVAEMCKQLRARLELPTTWEARLKLDRRLCHLGQLSEGERSRTAVARVAVPALAAFVEREGGDDERGGRVCPRPTQDRVED